MTEDRKTLVGTSATYSDATLYIDAKGFDGWKVLVPPFESDYVLEDIGEEETRPIPCEWTFVLQRGLGQ